MPLPTMVVSSCKNVTWMGDSVEPSLATVMLFMAYRKAVMSSRTSPTATPPAVLPVWLRNQMPAKVTSAAPTDRRLMRVWKNRA